MDNLIVIEKPWSYKQGDECLMAILESPVLVAFTDPLPRAQFRLGEEIYENLGLGSWNGFYNYLRISRDQVVGVEFQPADRNLLSVLQECILGNPQLVCEGPNFRIFFGTRTDFDPNWTSIGHFGWNSIFRSQNNRMAISFGLMGLSELARQNITSLSSLDK